MVRTSATLAVAFFAFSLVGCGTTSQVRPAQAADASAVAPAATELRAYERVVVRDFIDETSKDKIKPEDLQTYTDTVATATRTFADLIAQKLKATAAFSEVVRDSGHEPPGAGTLVISGRITRLTEGSRAARLLVGFGAGSAYFNATTDLADGETGAVIGSIATDKNSWALGGAIAASQNVHSFMTGAADKIAKEVATLKKDPAQITKD